MNALKTVVAPALVLIFSSTLSSAQIIISSVPYTINTPGAYILTQSLHYTPGSGNAITVTASNVTINLNGYGIINTSDQTKTTATCVFANNVENLTVENGEIFGFTNGIDLEGPGVGLNFNVGHIVQNLRLAYCTLHGILLNRASNCLIQNCQLSSIATTGGGVVVNFAYGVEIFSLAGGTRIYRCQVSNATLVGFLTQAEGSQGCYLEQNLATNCDFGFAFQDTVEAYRDNASFGCTTAFSGGNDWGGNHSQ
jgi:hypothetical protein